MEQSCAHNIIKSNQSAQARAPLWRSGQLLLRRPSSVTPGTSTVIVAKSSAWLQKNVAWRSRAKISQTLILWHHFTLLFSMVELALANGAPVTSVPLFDPPFGSGRERDQLQHCCAARVVFVFFRYKIVAPFELSGSALQSPPGLGRTLPATSSVGQTRQASSPTTHPR